VPVPRRADSLLIIQMCACIGGAPDSREVDARLNVEELRRARRMHRRMRVQVPDANVLRATRLLCVSARMLDPVACSPSNGLQVHSAGPQDLAYIDYVRRGCACVAQRMAGPGCARVARYSGTGSIPLSAPRCWRLVRRVPPLTLAIVRVRAIVSGQRCGRCLRAPVRAGWAENSALQLWRGRGHDYFI
jgi:hypothetical protein